MEECLPQPAFVQENLQKQWRYGPIQLLIALKYSVSPLTNVTDN